MSQTSFSFSPNKRPRTFSQLSNRSNRSVNFLQSAPTVITKVGPKREVGGSGVQRGGTAGKKNKKGISIPQNWIENLLYPKTYYKCLGYGVDMSGWDTASGNTTLKGDCKMLRGKPGRQVWVEFEALPLYNPSIPTETNTGSDVRTVNILGRRTIEQLINVAAENKWVDSVMDNAVGLPVETVFGSASATTVDDFDVVSHVNTYAGPSANAKLNKAFIYNGGHQRHTFINHSNASQWIEICEAVPRDPQFDWVHTIAGTPSTDTHLQWVSVGELLISDLKDNCVQSKSGDYIDTTSIDDVTDPLVRINSNCRRVLSKYKISKPMTICLAPGEQFVYTMDLPPFMFDNLGFAEHMLIPFPHTYGGFQRLATLRVRPTSIPRFTKRLLVRAWGEMSHANVDVTADTKFTGNLQPVQVNLFHLQEEEHKVRFAPVLNKGFSILKYERDQADTTYDLQIFDDANETIEAVDA